MPVIVVSGRHWRSTTPSRAKLRRAAIPSSVAQNIWTAPPPKSAQVLTLLHAAPLAKRGIRINGACPGLIDTPLITDFQTSMGAPILDWMKGQSGGRKAAPG
jgi:NAD(P)-dependent dehydrogenase (short-subunit alcohol dehydrogenase family)